MLQAHEFFNRVPVLVTDSIELLTDGSLSQACMGHTEDDALHKIQDAVECKSPRSMDLRIHR